MLAGALTGGGVLSVIGWAMLRYSRRLPITQFFAFASILIAVLAVVLAGEGTGGLQEAELLSIIEPLVQHGRHGYAHGLKVRAFGDRHTMG